MVSASSEHYLRSSGRLCVEFPVLEKGKRVLIATGNHVHVDYGSSDRIRTRDSV